ncbi:MAG: AraC family transcriptional regulator, partial [Melioribacteraceae bacterium]
YRIEEFKSQVNNPENKNLTFLAIAFQVGFNSKTTFNTAFKKIENKTPREYLYYKSIESSVF